MRWQTPSGDEIGRIVAVSEATVIVSCWAEANQTGSMDNYLVPPVIIDQHQIDIIPRPTLSLLIFVHHERDFLSFKARYICGMRDVYCTTDSINLSLPPPSLTIILYEAILRLFSEL